MVCGVSVLLELLFRLGSFSVCSGVCRFVIGVDVLFVFENWFFVLLYVLNMLVVMLDGMVEIDVVLLVVGLSGGVEVFCVWLFGGSVSVVDSDMVSNCLICMVG